jgi:hypothetical protein
VRDAILGDDVVDKIIKKNEELAEFWSKSEGWAPAESAELLSKSRLDWQVGLSKTLRIWDFQENQDGQLILAWANLGALIEGSLKLLLSVYYSDYESSEYNYKGKKGKLVDPDALALEKLKQFYQKNKILNEEWIIFIDLVQARRNAIHAFKDRPLGVPSEFTECVNKYMEFLTEIDGQLPYPDGSTY